MFHSCLDPIVQNVPFIPRPPYINMKKQYLIRSGFLYFYVSSFLIIFLSVSFHIEFLRGAQNIMTSVKYFWLQMKKYFEKIICFQNMTSLKSENNFEKNYDFGILKTYFQKYFWLRSEKYFEIIIFFQNMISSKSDQKNIFYSDFNFCQIRKLKYFLTSIFSSQIRKIFSILISIFPKLLR